MKKLSRLLVAAATLVCFLMIGVYLFLKNSLAPMDGTLKIQNLSHPVKITRDTYGIPHITAANKIDALRALGFVMASERLFQMEISRRMVHGRLSEVFGEIALPTDKLYRSLMLKRSGERMIEFEKSQGRFDSQMWAEMEAYFDGINQYIKTQPLPYEFTILGIKPEPFEPLDAYMMTGYMGYSFGIALKAEPLMTKLAKTLSQEQFQVLRNDPLKGPFKFTDKSSRNSSSNSSRNSANNSVSIEFNNLRSFSNNPSNKQSKRYGVAENSLPEENSFLGTFEGSNAWLISPGRSSSGKSIFANDPHIGYTSPAVWVEAHIKTPEFELYGHYLPLVPFAILGHNRHHAWGFTMALTDDMDLYREKLDTNNKTVLINNKPEKYIERNETIKIKDTGDLVLNMIETPHGPLMDAVLDEKNLALKWAFHKKENNTLKALHEMAEAKDIKTFESALQYATAPGLNVMYADSQNIAWWILGDIAVKKNSHSDMILNGSTGDDEYERLLKWDEKPHLINPASGIIVTANSRPMGLSENIRGDWQSDDRYQTIHKALSEKDQWSAEEFKTLQNENYNAKTKLIIDNLLKNIILNANEKYEYADLLRSLENWDSRSNLLSKEAAFYHQWNNENILLMLEAFDEKTRNSYLDTPYAWVFYERAVSDTNSAWWSSSTTGKKSFSEIITTGFRRTVNTLKEVRKWGDIHTIEYAHPLGKKFPLNILFNLGPYPIPGAYNDINNNKMKAMGGNFKVTSGPSTRRIIDFARPQKSWGINPIGISGHLLSPFYKDQVQMFIDGKYRFQLMDENDIQQAKTHELILQ